MILAQALPEILQSLTQFGVAGLMGVLWLWERLYSRRRERQLSQAHERLVQDREQLAVLIKLVQQNTTAIERFEQTQWHLTGLLETLRLTVQEKGGVQS